MLTVPCPLVCTVYEETRGVLKVFLENVIRDAVVRQLCPALSRALADSAPLDPAQVYATHACRKTVTGMDVVYALRRQGRTLCTRSPSESPSIMPLLLMRSLRLPADGFGG